MDNKPEVKNEYEILLSSLLARNKKLQKENDELKHKIKQSEKLIAAQRATIERIKNFLRRTKNELLKH